MFISSEELLKYLRCPQSGSHLTREKDKFKSKIGDFSYDVINGKPVLIDFAKSIFNRDECMISHASSKVKRRKYQGAFKYVKSVISPQKKQTLKNVERFVEQLLKNESEALVLVIGGGKIGQGLGKLYNCQKIKIISFDVYDSEHIQFIADAHQIPLASNSVDGVIIQAVLEHVLEPEKVVYEIHRVLKKAALIYAETPFMQPVHEGAYDFTRFTESGHRYLFRSFERIDSGASAGIGSYLMSAIDYFFRGLFRSRNLGKMMKFAFFWLRFFDRIIPQSFSVDGASGVYFLGRSSNKTLLPSEIADHYLGADG